MMKKLKDYFLSGNNYANTGNGLFLPLIFIPLLLHWQIIDNYWLGCVAVGSVLSFWLAALFNLFQLKVLKQDKSIRESTSEAVRTGLLGLLGGLLAWWFYGAGGLLVVIAGAAWESVIIIEWRKGKW